MHQLNHSVIDAVGCNFCFIEPYGDWQNSPKSVKITPYYSGYRHKIMTKDVNQTTENFEKQLEALEQIVSRMEEGELTLEDSIKEFEQGMKLANQCQKTLEQAELKVKVLMSEADGELEDFIRDNDGVD